MPTDKGKITIKLPDDVARQLADHLVNDQTEWQHELRHENDGEEFQALEEDLEWMKVVLDELDRRLK